LVDTDLTPLKVNIANLNPDKLTDPNASVRGSVREAAVRDKVAPLLCHIL
jgi:hypothetical protein